MTPAVRLRESEIASQKATWKWRKLARLEDLTVMDAGTT